MAVLDKLSVPTNTNENIGTVMPKLQYRFRVTFIFDGSDTRRATTNVISVTRPNLSHEEVTIDTYNSKIYVAGKHSWETVVIEMRDDIESDTSLMLDQQVSRQIDMASQSAPAAGRSYKFTTVIENLNGGNPTAEILDTWVLSGCWIQTLTYNESNYQSGGDYQQIGATIRFDNAEHIVNGTDLLTGGVHDNTVVGATV